MANSAIDVEVLLLDESSKVAQLEQKQYKSQCMLLLLQRFVQIQEGAALAVLMDLNE